MATRRPLAALERSRFLVLLIGLIAMLGFMPMISGDGRTALFLDVGLVLLLIACIWSMGRRKRVLVTGCVLLVPAVLAAWETGEGSRQALDVIGLACALAFLSITALELLVSLLRQREVVTDTVLGGICVYLLFAVIWALLYQMMERSSPGSFAGLSAAGDALAHTRLVSPDLVYYSVFVLSTIGPQDVHPISSAARSWTGIQAMVGQLYLAVLIARLVSQHAAQGDGQR
jgi:hypothetical protein